MPHYDKFRLSLFQYIIWSPLWIAWNIFIICMYIPIYSLDMYKSDVLSLCTSGFSYWESRAPGCLSDWASESKLVVTNCVFDPRLMEFLQSGLQVCLSVTGVVSAFIMLLKYNFDASKTSKENSGSNSTKNSATPNTVPSFLSSSGRRSTMGSRMSARNRPTIVPGTSGNNLNGDSSDQVTTNDDRLRPMTPRRVKRRSARSIQSQKFGTAHDRRNSHHDPGNDHERPSTSRAASSNNSARSSLRSNASSRRNHRNSKRKQNHQFISPVNRLMQQVDSETSHEEPGRYTYRDQVKELFSMKLV